MAIATMTVMAGATIAPSLPGMQLQFSAIANIGFWVSILLTISSLSIAVCAPVAGMIIDRFGRKKLLMFSLFLYGIAGSSGLYCKTITGMILGRAVLGIAVAGLMTCCTTLVADYFHGQERQKFIGQQVAFMNLGGVVFIVFGGFLATLHWRAPFSIYFLSLFILPAVYMIIEEPHQTGKKHADSELATNEIAWIKIFFAYATTLFGWAMFYLVPVKLPFYLKEVVNASPLLSGITIGIWALVATLSSGFYRRIHRHFSFQTIFVLLFLSGGIGFIVLAFASQYWAVILAMTLSGIGFGLMMPNVNVFLVEQSPARMRGRILGGMTTSNNIGQFIAPLVALPAIAFSGIGGGFGAFGTNGMLMVTVGVFFFLILAAKTDKVSPSSMPEAAQTDMDHLRPKLKGHTERSLKAEKE